MKIFKRLLTLIFLFLIVSSSINAQSIYIAELSFNPCTDQGSDADCEYLVINNDGANAVDISGYSIGNGFTYTFPAGTTIPVGGSISLGISGNCAAGTFDVSGGWTGSMSNSNDETIEILDAGGTLVSSVMYVGTIGDGDCMATCFDAAGTASACTSSVLATPTFDCPAIMANIGDACTDSDGDTSTIAADCICTEVTPTFDCPAIMANIGDVCTDSDGDTSNIAADCTCTEVTPPPAADIYISELSFNPCVEQGNDGDCEYLVLTNNGATAADISNYSIGNGFTYTFPAGTTIPAGGSISLGISGNCTSGTFDLSGSWGGSMSNSNDETIEILDSSGALISSVTYDGTIGDGDCMASCFDASGTVSACPSSVLTNPVFDCPAIMANIGDACTDSDGDTSTIAADCTCTEVTPTFDCPAIMANIGDACDDGDSTTANDLIDVACVCVGTPIVGNCPTSAKINEFHYDNDGTDANEFVEIALPAGSDPSQVQIDLYNGSNGTSYALIVLSSAEFVSSDGTFDYYVWNASPQNGPDGIAVSCIDGTQYQFITYEGVFMATDGPFAGAMGVDVGVGVEETSSTTDAQSIMCDGTGIFFTNCTADPGVANDINSCVTIVMGCTDPCADNYDPTAEMDDGTCNPYDMTCNTDCTVGDIEIWDATACLCVVDVPTVLGCTDNTACNFDANANCDDASCLPAPVCNTDPCAGDTEIIDPTDACVCIIDQVQVLGCTDNMANNYDANANCDDGSCIFSNPGCTDPCADNYDPNADMDDGTCNPYDTTCNADCTVGDIEVWDATTCSCVVDIATVLGCTDSMANNYDPNANCDDGTCIFSNPGCTDPCADNYDPNADTDDGSCNPYDMTCNTDCTVGDIEVWDATTCSCVVDIVTVLGCTDNMANNFDANANCDDGSCLFSNSGCTDPCADNYDPNADTDDGSCNPYDMTCNADCTVGDIEVWDATTCSCVADIATVLGCTDSMANNYDPNANCNDGSCITVCEEEIVGSIVVSDQGCDVSGLEVMIMAPDGTSVTVITDANGNFSVPGGPFMCGSYSATITDANVPACYTETGSIGPIQFIVDGAGGGDDGPLFVANPAIPTLSQWGLIILALLLMTIGALKLSFQNVRIEKYSNK